jgi:hypothetical protein
LGELVSDLTSEHSQLLANLTNALNNLSTELASEGLNFFLNGICALHRHHHHRRRRHRHHNHHHHHHHERLIELCKVKLKNEHKPVWLC